MDGAGSAPIRRTRRCRPARATSYGPNDLSTGDLDGDGRAEVVGATDLSPTDASYEGLSGYRGVPLIGGNTLQFLITGAGPSAEFTRWAYLSGLPEGQKGAADDPDGGGLPNLLEFALGLEATRPGGDGLEATTIEVDGEVYPAARFTRRTALGGVRLEVHAAPALDFESRFEVVEVSAEARGDGTDLVLVRSTVPLSQQPATVLAPRGDAAHGVMLMSLEAGGCHAARDKSDASCARRARGRRGSRGRRPSSRLRSA